MFVRAVLPARQEHRPPGHQAGECRLRRQELRKLPFPVFVQILFFFWDNSRGIVREN